MLSSVEGTGEDSGDRGAVASVLSLRSVELLPTSSSLFLLLFLLLVDFFVARREEVVLLLRLLLEVGLLLRLLLEVGLLLRLLLLLLLLDFLEVEDVVSFVISMASSTISLRVFRRDDDDDDLDLLVAGKDFRTSGVFLLLLTPPLTFGWYRFVKSPQSCFSKDDLISWL